MIVPGLISTRGMTYRTGLEKCPTMVTAGTMTRHTEDIIPFLKLLLKDNVSKLKLDTKVWISLCKQLCGNYNCKPNFISKGSLKLIKYLISNLLCTMNYIISVP